MQVSHGCYTGTTSHFDDLRLLLAQAAGYGVVDLRDQGGPIMPRIPYDEFSPEDMAGEWPEGAPDDPLLILLVHEEKRGRIKTAHCHYLADRLEQLESVFMKIGLVPWVLVIQQFARGLRTAAHYGQDVIFECPS